LQTFNSRPLSFFSSFVPPSPSPSPVLEVVFVGSGTMSSEPSDPTPKSAENDTEKGVALPVAAEISGDDSGPEDIEYPSGAGFLAVVAALALTMLLVQTH
jgi:hypothetical protein